MINQELNILGFHGGVLSIIFELLYSDAFRGHVRIILNDGIQRSESPFDTGISHEIIDNEDLSAVPEGEFAFCSTGPFAKRFLSDLYSSKWGISPGHFATLKHESSVIARTAQHREGLLMEPLSVISAYTTLGFGVTIGRNCSIGHHCLLGDFSTLSPGANVCGNVNIGQGVAIGPGSTVFNGVEIGDGTIIGGGSVVTRTIPQGVLAYGNPCKVIKKLDT